MVADGKSTKTNKTYTDDDRTRKQVLDLSIIKYIIALNAFSTKLIKR